MLMSKSGVAKLFLTSLVLPMWKRYGYIPRKTRELQIDLHHSPPKSFNEKGPFSFFVPDSLIVACKESILIQEKQTLSFSINLPVN